MDAIDVGGQLAAEVVLILLLAGDLGVRAVLGHLVVELLLVVLVAEGLVAGAHGLLDNEPPCVVALLPQCRRVHLTPGSPGVDGVLLYDVVEHPIGASLYHGSVVGTANLVAHKLLILEQADVLTVFWRDQLSLHGVGNRLVSVVPDGRGVLDAVGDDAADAAGVNGCAVPDEV